MIICTCIILLLFIHVYFIIICTCIILLLFIHVVRQFAAICLFANSEYKCTVAELESS